ncbi:MAG: hypothetical protein WCI89_02505, partial [bacterium]
NSPIVSNTTPYISLSAVPYTGLELGPIGLVVYWSTLVLFCLGVAYTVTVRRARAGIPRLVKEFLFGTSGETSSQPALVAHYKASVQSPAPSQKTNTTDITDAFLFAQIHSKFNKTKTS